MATQAPAPAPISVPLKKRPCRTSPDGYAPKRTLRLRHGMSDVVFAALVEAGSIRSRQLPGEKYARYHEGDVERAVLASIQGGSPEPTPAA